MRKLDTETTDAQKICVQIVLTPHLIKRLDAEAQRRTMSRSLLIRLACEKLLQQETEALA